MAIWSSNQNRGHRTALLATALFVGLTPSAAQTTQASSPDDARPTPLFHTRLAISGADTPDVVPEVQASLARLVPDDLRDTVVLELPLSIFGRPKTYLGPYRDMSTPGEFCHRFNKYGYRFTMDIGRPDYPDRVVTLADIEDVFKHDRHCIGVSTGELFWLLGGFEQPLQRFMASYRIKYDKTFYDEHFGSMLVGDYFFGVLDLCKRYDKVFILAEGNLNNGAWFTFTRRYAKRFAERGYAPSFIPLYKGTFPASRTLGEAAVVGMGVTQMVHRYGTWGDSCEWGHLQFGDVGQIGVKASRNTFPYLQFVREYILSMAYGGSVFGKENPLMAAWLGEEQRYLFPFYRAVANHRLIPRPEAVKAKIKVLLNPDVNVAAEKMSYERGPFAPLVRNTYGLSDRYSSRVSVLNTIPETARFYIIPFLPAESQSAPAGMEVLNLSALASDEQVRERIIPLYPPTRSRAWAVEVDDRFFVLNTNENTDEDQSFSFTLGTGGLRAMSGSISLMSYLIGVRRPTAGGVSYWFQTHGHVPNPRRRANDQYTLSTRPMTLTFQCTSRPTVTVEDAHADSVQSKWDETTRTQTVTCDYTHGAAEFSITTE